MTYRMPDSYYDPPEPTPVPLRCMLCGKATKDEDLWVPDHQEHMQNILDQAWDDGDYTVYTCRGCKQAGGITVDWVPEPEPDWLIDGEESDEWVRSQDDGYDPVQRREIDLADDAHRRDVMYGADSDYGDF